MDIIIGETTYYMKDEQLLRIAQHLIMHASFITDLGLYHGKMGIILFFVHYARYAGESLYDEFAGELLDEIQKEIHAGVPVNFESGLCGIGWGIEYLLQNGFMEGDSDEILTDIDGKVMERDIRRLTDRSLRTGLTGISYYIKKRLDSPRGYGMQPFDATYLEEWENVAKDIAIPNDKLVLQSITESLPGDDEITAWSSGLENGCAGWGLKQILR